MAEFVLTARSLRMRVIIFTMVVVLSMQTNLVGRETLRFGHCTSACLGAIFGGAFHLLLKDTKVG